jgi:phytoene dehydrogenase-like protein
MSDAPVVIVGAGLAGLACATTLHAAGVPVKVVEASDGVGGRVRTDRVDGFLLDRGFQVLLTAYPEVHRQLDVQALDLRAFEPGALVWRDGRGAVLGDPFREPGRVLATATAPVGTIGDKLRVALLRHRVRARHPARMLQERDATSEQRLRELGFSDRMVDGFFRPLLGGIQLDPALASSANLFEVVFRMLADGDAAVPASGMGAIPDQLAARLPPGTIELGVRAESVTGASVVTTRHGPLPAAAVVVACEGPAAAHLLGLPPVESKPVGCVWFTSEEPPTRERLIVLDGTGRGPVLNVAVLSNVAPTYAPPGRHLVVAAMPGLHGDDLEPLARRQLRGWWGGEVDRWEHVRTYRIAHGQPNQRPPLHPKRRVALGDGRFVCGDHRDTASSQGALFSGRRCAMAVLDRLGLRDTDGEHDARSPPV